MAATWSWWFWQVLYQRLEGKRRHKEQNLLPSFVATSPACSGAGGCLHLIWELRKWLSSPQGRCEPEDATSSWTLIVRPQCPGTAGVTAAVRPLCLSAKSPPIPFCWKSLDSSAWVGEGLYCQWLQK